jgi:hypothetical protein
MKLLKSLFERIRGAVWDPSGAAPRSSENKPSGPPIELGDLPDDTLRLVLSKTLGLGDPDQPLDMGFESEAGWGAQRRVLFGTLDQVRGGGCSTHHPSGIPTEHSLLSIADHLLNFSLHVPLTYTQVCKRWRRLLAEVR